MVLRVVLPIVRWLVLTVLVVGCADALPDSPDYIADESDVTSEKKKEGSTAAAQEGDTPSSEAASEAAPSKPVPAPTAAPAEVVPAGPPVPPGTLRVMTINIVHADYTDEALDPVADAIKAARADVVAVQQVDEGVERTRNQRQTSELARLAGMRHTYFGAAFDLEGGKFGNSILSKYPLEKKRVIRLDARTTYTSGQPEPRIAVAADIVIGGGVVPFFVVNAPAVAAERAANAEKLVAAIGEDISRAIVAGYFNENPRGELGKALAAKGMLDTFAERHPTSTGYTSPAARPTRRSSFIYRGASITTTEASWVPAVEVSHHRPLASVIKLK